MEQQDRLIWRPLPEKPALTGRLEPPYDGSSVLLKTRSGAIQGRATIETRPEGKKWEWNIKDTSAGGKKDPLATYWVPAPSNPYADPATWDNKPKPTLRSGESYLVYNSSVGWVEARCQVFKSREPRWFFLGHEERNDSLVKYWMALPIMPFEGLEEWRNAMLSASPELWS